MIGEKSSSLVQALPITEHLGTRLVPLQPVAPPVIVTLRAHAQSGVKQSVLSVCHLYISVCQKNEISPHSPHKPSKGSQIIANNKKLLYVYLTDFKTLRFVVF